MDKYRTLGSFGLYEINRFLEEGKRVIVTPRVQIIHEEEPDLIFKSTKRIVIGPGHNG